MEGITILGSVKSEASQLILTAEALQFVALLHRKFNQRRLDLLHQRTLKQQKISSGWRPTFAPETNYIRNSSWQVAACPDDLQRRHCEITGPTSPAKMVQSNFASPLTVWLTHYLPPPQVINALNSGANGFMADFEDALSPFWEKLLDGQKNMYLAVRKALMANENSASFAVNFRTKICSHGFLQIKFTK